MAEEQGLSRTPRGARLPPTSIEETLPIARALQELAAPSTVQRLGGHLGVSPSGGRFRTRVGAAGTYGLTVRVGDRRKLTNLGERALRSDGEGVLAQRIAVMNTGFRAIFTIFRGREVNESTIQARLVDDYGVPEAAAAGIAQALVESGQTTGLISGNRFDAAAIEEAIAQAEQDAPEETDSTDTPQPSRQAASRHAPVKPVRSAVSQTVTPPAASAGRPSPAVHIDVQIHIPATATPEQIDQIFASMAKHLYSRD